MPQKGSWSADLAVNTNAEWRSALAIPGMKQHIVQAVCCRLEGFVIGLIRRRRHLEFRAMEVASDAMTHVCLLVEQVIEEWSPERGQTLRGFLSAIVCPKIRDWIADELEGTPGVRCFLISQRRLPAGVIESACRELRALQTSDGAVFELDEEEAAVDCIRCLLRRLHRPYREILCLWLFGDLNLTEISDSISRSTEVVRQKIVRICRHARREFAHRSSTDWYAISMTSFLEALARSISAEQIRAMLIEFGIEISRFNKSGRRLFDQTAFSLFFHGLPRCQTSSRSTV